MATKASSAASSDAWKDLMRKKRNDTYKHETSSRGAIRRCYRIYKTIRAHRFNDWRVTILMTEQAMYDERLNSKGK